MQPIAVPLQYPIPYNYYTNLIICLQVDLYNIVYKRLIENEPIRTKTKNTIALFCLNFLFFVLFYFCFKLHCCKLCSLLLLEYTYMLTTYMLTIICYITFVTVCLRSIAYMIKYIHIYLIIYIHTHVYINI